jgi:Spy/CpxP family protein refolding chaperone
MRQLLFLSLIPLTLGFAIPSYAQPASPTSPDSITRLSGKPGLNLSDSQKAQMRALRQKTKEQIMAVLTPSQRSQLASALQSGQSFRQAMRSLNLTDAQKQQIRAIRESSRQQRLAILTPEQRAQLEQRRRF